MAQKSKGGAEMRSLLQKFMQKSDRRVRKWKVEKNQCNSHRKQVVRGGEEGAWQGGNQASAAWIEIPNNRDECTSAIKKQERTTRGNPVKMAGKKCKNSGCCGGGFRKRGAQARPEWK